MTKEELEKEAKQSYHNTTAEMQWGEEDEIEYTRGYQDGAEPREKRIAELEKENTELKNRDCWRDCLYASGKSELIHEILQQQYNLTKAKEIMKEMLSVSPKENIEGIYEIIEEAEAFLKEEKCLSA